MELKKVIESGSTKIEDHVSTELRIKLIDITNTNSLVAYGEIRIDNFDFKFDNAFTDESAITVDISLGDQDLTRVFTGIITEVFQGEIIVLQVRGKGETIKDKKVKKSFNQTSASEIIRFILNESGVDFELGTIPEIRRHSYVIPNESVISEILRFNKSFELELIPYFDREGKLILKTLDEATNETDVEFLDDEFVKFEDGTLETVVDVAIKLFDKIDIMGDDYIVASHRIFLDERKSKSFITVTET